MLIFQFTGDLLLNIFNCLLLFLKSPKNNFLSQKQLNLSPNLIKNVFLLGFTQIIVYYEIEKY